MICKIQPKTYKMTSNWFAYNFWLCHFKTWNWQKHENQENLKTLTNNQYLKHTPNLPTQHNLILSSGHRPNFDSWSCITKYWPSFAKFDNSFLTISLSNWCHTSPTPISHHIFPIQRWILNLSLEHYRYVLLHQHKKKFWFVTFP